MAIKGKKKSQRRGSQARRRPAPAPRPVPGPRRRTPWYRTAEGRVFGGITALVLIGILIAVIANARSNSADESRRRAAFERYTDGVRNVLQDITPVAAAMSAITNNADAATVKVLKQNAVAWQKTFKKAATALNASGSAATADISSNLFRQAIALYGTSAATYQIVPTISGDAQRTILLNAGVQRSQADQLWLNAVATLDRERARVGAGPSGLRVPSSAPAGGPPTPQPSPTGLSSTAGAGNGTGKGGSGKKSGGSGGNGSGNGGGGSGGGG